VQLISESCSSHIDNFHGSPSKEYLKSLAEIERRVSEYINLLCEAIASSDYRNEKEITERHKNAIAYLNDRIDREISVIQDGDVGNRIGLLQMRLLLETKDILVSLQEIFGLYHDYHKQA
jgi:hypothetical protein